PTTAALSSRAKPARGSFPRAGAAASVPLSERVSRRRGRTATARSSCSRPTERTIRQRRRASSISCAPATTTSRDPAFRRSAAQSRIIGAASERLRLLRVALVGGFTPRNAALALLVAVPMAAQAIGLLPEVTVPVANVNDDTEHALYIENASDALARGENVLDFWVPEMDEGFPQFLYYQNLPHLSVIALHRILLATIDIFTVFNLVRYLGLVLFPLTVFWSMRRMEF